MEGEVDLKSQIGRVLATFAFIVAACNKNCKLWRLLMGFVHVKSFWTKVYSGVRNCPGKVNL